MKSLSILLLSASLLSACSSITPTRIPSSTPEMEYVELCKTPGDCRKFSRLVMGTDHLVQGGWTETAQPEISEAEAREVLNEAAKLGINLFDTSPIYVGGVEYKLGRWLKIANQDSSTRNLNPDGKLYALSKGGFPFDLFYSKKLETGTHSAELRDALRREGILGAARASEGSIDLKDVPPGTYASRLFGNENQITSRVAEELGHSTTNLNGEIAIYLMHRDDADYLRFNEVPRKQTPVTAIMKALASPEIATKHWMGGWSNWQTSRVNASIQAAAKNPALPKPAINSPYFSLFEMSARTIHAGGVQVTHEEMMDPSFQPGIRIMPYSPLGGFSVFDKPEPIWENAKQSAREKFEAGDAYWKNVYPAIFTAANEARFQRVVAFTSQFNRAHSTNYTIDQMINAYALAHPRTDFLAVGPITVEQLRRTVGALKLAKLLTTENLEFLHSGN